MAAGRAIHACLTFVLIGVISPTAALASLGGDTSSIGADRIQMQGALRQITGVNAFTVHEMQSASGIIVREYVSSAGTVFGVTWQGAAFPNLRQLLGPYFIRFQQEADRQVRTRKRRGPLNVDLGDVIVQSSGHPRSFTGRAYVPGLVPQGVGIDAIR
jgi:hypothetical protein